MDKHLNDFDALEKATVLLQNNIVTFPLGALSTDDLITTSEKIKILRKSLISLKTRIQMLKVKQAMQTVNDPPDLTLNELDEIYKNKVSETMITNKTITMCHQSKAVQFMLYNEKADPQQKRKVKALLEKLYFLNDKLISNHMNIDPDDQSKSPTISQLRQQQIMLKCECDTMTIDFGDFLKSQQNIRNEKLKELNPKSIENKEKNNSLKQKINLMKRLITNFIATAGSQHMNSEFVNYLWQHRDLIDDESLKKMMLEHSES